MNGHANPAFFVQPGDPGYAPELTKSTPTAVGLGPENYTEESNAFEGPSGAHVPIAEQNDEVWLACRAAALSCRV